MAAEKIKIIKDKACNSRGRGKCEFAQAYKSYADYAFLNDATRHSRCENTADSVPCKPTNGEFQLPNWKCVLRNCSACNYIALPRVERDSSNQAPMIVFNTYITQFTCSYHGILIRKKISTYLDAKGTS